MTTIDIIQQLLSQEDIASIRFAKFDKSHYIQDNPSISKVSLKVIDNALEIKKLFDLPFWSAVNIANCQLSDWSQELIALSDHHNESYYFEVSDINTVKDISLDPNLGINSRVILASGEVRHIPMLDFHIKHFEHSLDLVRLICRQLNQRSGYILDSGASYHYVGNELLNEDAFISFLAHSLLFSPIVDNRWVAHQLLERSATLRVGKKNDVFPLIIESLNFR